MFALFRDIWVDGHPGTRKYGENTTPNDVPNRTLILTYASWRKGWTDASLWRKIHGERVRICFQKGLKKVEDGWHERCGGTVLVLTGA